MVLVVGIDQVDLRLMRGLGEGEARLQRLELLDRLAVARLVHGLLGPGVNGLGARSGIVRSMAAAACTE